MTGLKLEGSAERDKRSPRCLFLVEEIFSSGAVTHLLSVSCGGRNLTVCRLLPVENEMLCRFISALLLFSLANHQQEGFLQS